MNKLRTLYCWLRNLPWLDLLTDTTLIWIGFAIGHWFFPR